MNKSKKSIYSILLNPSIIFLLLLLLIGFHIASQKTNVLDIRTGNEKSMGSLSYVQHRNDSQGDPVQKASFTNKKKNILTESSTELESSFKFKDATLESGMDFYHSQGGKMLSAITELVSSGACACDYDNDGFVDIYAVNGTGFTHFYGKKWWWSKTPYNTLYHNSGDGKFTNVTEKANVGDKGWGMGCAFGDYDNDGNPDLYVSNYGKNILYHNNGDGTFTDLTEKAGVGDEGWGMSVAWGDYDNDGDLDIYIANYIVFDKKMNPAEPNSAFKMNIPLLMRSTLFDAQRNVLYQNNGDGTFTDITDKAGVGNPSGRSMGVVFSDYNNDGFLDIYITNDGSRNVLYKNNKNGTFSDVGGELGVDSPLSGMGITVGDYDNDGDMDLFSTYPQSDTNILYKNLLSDFLSPKDNKLYADNKEFIDVTVDSGLGEDISVGYFGWGAEFVDFDNDGYLDIFVANGNPMPDFDNPQATIGQNNQLLRNNQDGTFTDITERVGDGLQRVDSTRGAVFSDFDNDGDIDIFLANNNGYAGFLLNEENNDNKWLNISLKGTKSNKDAIGARVRVVAENLQQVKEVRSGSGYLSQSDIRLNFGLEKHGKADLIEVKWPSGRIQQFRNIEANRFLTIVENQNELKTFVGKKNKKNKTQEITKQRENQEVRIEAIKAFGLLKDKRGIEVLVGLLKDEDALIRKETVVALGNRKDDKAVEPLIILLNNETDINVKREIINVLKNFESDKIIYPLINALSSDDIEIRRGAAASLCKLLQGEQAIFRSTMLKKRIAVVPLLKALDDPDEIVRKCAVKALGYSESYRAVIPISNMFKDKEKSVRIEAVRASGLLRDKRAVAPLWKLLKDNLENESVRAQAILALNRLESKMSLKPLMAIAEDAKDNNARYKAVLVMRQLLDNEESVIVDKKEIINYLQKGIKDSDYRIRKEIVTISKLINTSDYTKILQKASQDTNNEVKREATLAAIKKSVYRGNNGVEFLSELINDKKMDKETHLAALYSLIKLDSLKAINMIKGLLKNENAEVRSEYIKVLGLTNNQNAIKLLLNSLEKDKDVNVKQEVVSSLQKFAKKTEVFSALLSKLRNRKINAEIRLRILSILTKSQPQKMFSHLVKIVNNKTDELRFEAIEYIASQYGTKGINILLNILKSKKNDTRVRAKAAFALSKINDKRVYDALITLI